MTVLAPNDPRHGTNNGYNNLRCRCGSCREAARRYRVEKDYATYHREWRHRTGRNKPMDVHLAEIEAQHGTESRYCGGCRCSECKDASAAARNTRRGRSAPAVHGRAASYSNGCRCSECREAHRVYQNTKRANQREAA